MSSTSNSSKESLAVVEQDTGAEQVAAATISAPGADDVREQPWRLLPAFESFKDNVHVNKVRDMRLFGNHVNAHS